MLIIIITWLKYEYLSSSYYSVIVCYYFKLAGFQDSRRVSEGETRPISKLLEVRRKDKVKFKYKKEIIMGVYVAISTYFQDGFSISLYTALLLE